MRIAAETLQKDTHLLVHHGVIGHQCVELGLLRPARQVAIQDQVADIQKIAVLRKLVDGIAAIQQLALVAIDRSEEHPSELQSLMRNSYAVYCFKKKSKT